MSILKGKNGHLLNECQLYYCDNCGNYGYHSIYLTKEGKPQCTDCANKMRFGVRR